MYMILVGGGKVGYHLAKSLLAEGHELPQQEELLPGRDGR